MEYNIDTHKMKLKERNNVQGEEWNIVQGKTSSNEN